MRRKKISSILLLILIIGSIISLDITRRYLSGEFEQDKLELEVLYSSEKAGWLKSVVGEYEKQWSERNNGQQISVIITPIGSGKGTLQVASAASKPVVWSPASRFWLSILNRLWLTNNPNPIVDTDSPSLVISPSVIATWQSYLETNQIKGFQDLRDLAVNDPNFTFAHTDPFESNSGFGAVIMESAVAAGKNPENLTIDDLAKDNVQQWMRELEGAAIQYGSSTGFLGKLMASEGPSRLKAAVIYENLILEKNKELKDDKLVAIYPEEGTLLNDHPYAILDAPWVSEQDKILAQDFLDFLKSPSIQIKAIDLGFRPSINTPEVIAEVQSFFTAEKGVRNSLDGINIYSISNIRDDVLERIPDLWSATRSRSLSDDTQEEPKLTLEDYVLPVILFSLIFLIITNPIIVRFRRYIR